MLYYNWKTMRYERVDDTRPDLLDKKLDDWGRDDDSQTDSEDW